MIAVGFDSYITAQQLDSVAQLVRMLPWNCSVISARGPVVTFFTTAAMSKSVYRNITYLTSDYLV